VSQGELTQTADAGASGMNTQAAGGTVARKRQGNSAGKGQGRRVQVRVEEKKVESYG
jgi:hypothetical protein